jgi:enediyne biosynthesis protein E4
VLAKTQKGSPDPLLQVDEVRSGGSYYSQNDLRLHFGLDQAQVVETLEVRWLSGQVDTFKNLAVKSSVRGYRGRKEPSGGLLR